MCVLSQFESINPSTSRWICFTTEKYGAIFQESRSHLLFVFHVAHTAFENRIQMGFAEFSMLCLILNQSDDSF